MAKIITDIGYGYITISHPMISEDYRIEKNKDSGKFYVYSGNGFYTRGIVEFQELGDAIKLAKKEIKNYYESRGLDNPKGF